MKRLAVPVLCLAICAAAVVGCKKPTMAAPDLPEVLTDRWFGELGEPVTITWFSQGLAGSEGAVTLVGTGQVAPPKTKWMFTDPTPVWRCFSGVKTHHFEEGAYASATAMFWLKVGKGGRPEGSLMIYALDRASVSSPRWAREGGEWQFDQVAAERLAKLLSSTPPAELGASSRR
jgi:hypothetical protein